MGADMINVAREAMLAIGCLQTQKCHEDTCPTGVATQNKWLAHGLDPQQKKHRMANYVLALRKDLLKISDAIGVAHPALIGPEDLELMDGVRRGVALDEVFGYPEGYGRLGLDLAAEIERIMVEGDFVHLGGENEDNRETAATEQPTR